MIEIVVSVCLVQEPGQCKDVTLNFMAENVTPRECMFVGQTEIAKWTEGHPGWSIQKWTCAPAGRIAKV